MENSSESSENNTVLYEGHDDSTVSSLSQNYAIITEGEVEPLLPVSWPSLMLVLVGKKGKGKLVFEAHLCENRLSPSFLCLSSIVYIGMQLVSTEWLPVHHNTESQPYRAAQEAWDN